MGIKHFFYWYKKQFGNNIKSLSRGMKMNDSVDTLLLDLNGFFHNSAQKIFEYGNGKKEQRLMRVAPRIVHDTAENRKRVYNDVCQSIEKLVKISNPRKRIFLGIDGVAPISKQNQQRQRRFRSAFESSGDKLSFDSNSITPGTIFMDELSIYIDKFIQSKKVTDSVWEDLEIIFSDEKVPGEGEHKAVEFIRENGSNDEVYCINGLDADLIMLALATHKRHFHIIREDMYDETNEYFCLNIGESRNELIDIMRWNNNIHKFNDRDAINDFIFICFMVGNDFLPHIPSIEIIEDGIELMIDIYKTVASIGGHLTTTHKNGMVIFNKPTLMAFLVLIGKCEKANYEKKLSRGRSFFPDPLLLKNASNDSSGVWNVNVNAYNTDYNNDKFGTDADMETVCHRYIQGLQWVLTYYTTGCPSWSWCYPYQYAPSASILAEHVPKFIPCKYDNDPPSQPFQQLISVLPPASAGLLPQPLRKILTSPGSPLSKFCPTTLKIDLAGKRKEWEGIPIIPIVDQNVVKTSLDTYISSVKDKDIARNTPGPMIIYESEK
jgi:5'-3' exoribonuclease 1